MTEAPDVPLRVARTLKLAEEWALVLVADNLSPRVVRAREGYVLGVPADEAERAARALSAYESENRTQESAREGQAAAGHAGAGLVVSGALLAFFGVTGPRNPAVSWFERGSADAERILHGELFRTVTALTLHADLEHAVANTLAGALFLGAVCAALGPGFGCALVLLSGAGGNLINAWVQGPHHVAVGASTAIFGAVGVLSGLGVARRRRSEALERRAWMPVAAGFAILAMLGTAGTRVDLWAHLFGLLVGAALGIPVGFAVARPPGRSLQWILAGSAIAAVLYCWARALE
jgi:membrane associated rhomboid family serine protease